MEILPLFGGDIINIQSIQIKNGIKAHHIRTDKFKTTTLGVYFHRPLCKEEATKNALLANVLKRGCPLFPTTIGLSGRLDSLYGAKLVSGVRKKGESQIIHINLEFANERFLPGSQPVLAQVLDLVRSMVFAQTGFDAEYVSQEKENLRQNILSQINDKRSYAINRCIQLMCEGEAYGLSELGCTEDIDPIDADALFAHYQKVLQTSPIDIFIVGGVDFPAAKDGVADMLASLPERAAQYPNTQIVTSVGEVKRVTETENILQGKLSLGFRTKVSMADGGYAAMMLYNAVLGGGPSSKLFNNVREKLSLAYYAMSRTDSFKGVMTVNCGIEVSNFDKAYDEILVQIAAIKDGGITDEEFHAALLSTVNNIKSIADSALSTEDYFLGRLIIGSPLTFEQLTEALQSVTKRQVVDIANNIELDTVYFLRGNE